MLFLQLWDLFFTIAMMCSGVSLFPAAVINGLLKTSQVEEYLCYELIQQHFVSLSCKINTLDYKELTLITLRAD